MPGTALSPRRLVRGVALLVVSLMAAGGGSPAAEATTTVARVRHTYHPRAGLTLTSLRYTDPDVQVRVLEFSPGPGSDGYTVDVGVGGPEITSRATPSSIGADRRRRRRDQRRLLARQLSPLTSMRLTAISARTV